MSTVALWASGGVASAALPSGVDADYQLGGANDAISTSVGIVVRDREAAPKPGAFNICYVNGFQTQPNERAFWRSHRRLLLTKGGRPVVDEAWGERLLDIRTPRKRQRLARIVGGWVRGCAEAGFDAVEFDNLDSFTRSHGLISRRQAIGFARMLVREAHRYDLEAGQKNLSGFDGTRIEYDFAVAEECGAWEECKEYASHYGDQVIAIEYSDAAFDVTCASYSKRWPVVRRDRDLSPTGVHRYC